MTGFQRKLAAAGVRLRHSTPYHPQTCGKVDAPDTEEMAGHQPSARTIAALQAQLDAFRDYYNNRRPHRALGRRTAQAYAARPKALPDAAARRARPLPRPPRQDRQDRRRHPPTTAASTHIGVGRQHAGKHVRMLIRELHIRVITEDGELLET